MTFFLLFLAMIFNLLAQSVLKHAISGIKFDTFTFQTVFKFVWSPYIWTGAFLYGISFLFYIFALSRGELSRISPASQALTTLGIIVISIIFFNEPLNFYKIIGVILLILGTLVIFL